MSGTTTFALDPIGLEVLRHQLDAVCEEGARAIARTSVSPIVVEVGDFSCTLLDARGRLVAGGGKLAYHFHVATNAVQAVLREYDSDVGDGDVFLANDPHDGGGLHQQDVFVMRPVFADGALTAWIANSAHMLDVGGMTPGSFAPTATDCFQEAIRVPPVRLARAGEEQRDIWRLLLNNVRVADLVELDLRGLVAGAQVAADHMKRLAGSIGVAQWRSAVDELCSLTEAAVRGEISLLEDGTYRSTSWVEWGPERFRVPCTVTVEGNTLTFDFDGASPQTDHFFNAKAYIIKGKLGVDLHTFLGQDLPLNEGFYAAFDVRCPAGTIVDCVHPAPVGAGHIMTSHDATEAALRALHQAIAISPESPARPFLSCARALSANSLVTWSGKGLTGTHDVWPLVDPSALGSPAAHDADGTDCGPFLFGTTSPLQTNDVEITESWHPIRFLYRRAAPGTGGAGRFRGGAGVELVFELAGSPRLTGTATGGHTTIPAAGAAGGLPGEPTKLAIELADGTRLPVATSNQSFELSIGDRYVVQAGGAGGWGDPLDRDPEQVERDVVNGRLSAAEATEVYGVVPGPPSQTAARRQTILDRRLRNAQSPARPVHAETVAVGVGPALACGVVQVGNVAVSARSGALLAVAPNHWTDGCPVFIEAVSDDIERRSYLDPGSGHLLHVEVAPRGEPRSFESTPSRWRQAGADAAE